MRAPGLATLAVVTLIAAHAADAAFCKKRNGAVFARDACKAKETEVDLGVVGGAPKGDPGPPGRSHPRLRVVDGNGQQLPGTFGQLGEFVFRQAGRPFSVFTLTSGFLGGIVLFDGPTCTGARWIRVLGFDLYHDAFVQGGIAYYAGDPIEMHTSASYARLTSPQDCTGGGVTYLTAEGLCCFTSGFSAMAGPPTPFDLGGFPLPFRVEIEE